MKERIYIAQNLDKKSISEPFKCFQVKGNIKYRALCDDFGPMNLSSIVRFVQSMNDELEHFPNNKIVMFVSKGKRNLTNAVFLLGTYMLLKENSSPKAVARTFPPGPANSLTR